MFKKAIFTLLALTMLFSSPIDAKEKKKSEKSPGGAIFVMASLNDVKFETKKIMVTKDEGSIEITYPELSGLEDKGLEDFINGLFKMTSEQSYQQMSRQMIEQQAEAPYQLIKNFKVKDSLPHLLVIGAFEYCYIGGTCGYAKQNYLTVDLNTQRILTLDDLFSNCAYKRVIRSAIAEQIEGRTQNLTITGDEVFYINAAGDLVLVFNLSDIETNGSGILEFIIQKDLIEEYYTAL